MLAILERTFRLLSLSFLAVGFLVGVAGADKDGNNEVVSAAREMIRNINDVDEANAINSGSNQPVYIIGTDEEIDMKPTVAMIQADAAESRNLETPVK